MRFLIGIVLLIGVAIFAFTQRAWERTDVDIQFSNYYRHGAEEYKENCFKPKVFRGFLKFKVSCSDMFSFVADDDTTEQQIDEYFARHVLTTYERVWDWSIIKAIDLDNYDISRRKSDPPVYILKREQSEYPNCERLIFLTYSYKTGKVYFADPRKLYCEPS